MYGADQVDYAYNNFLSIFSNLYDLHLPYYIKTEGKPARNQPWITQSIINSINHKNRLYRCFLRNPTDINAHTYKVYCNHLTAVIRSVKKKYYAHKLDANKSNIKNVWREINNILGSKRKEDPPESLSDGTSNFTTPDDISESFNTYFSNIGASLANKIPSTDTSFSSYLHGSFGSTFFLTPTNFVEVTEIGCTLKSSCSCGFDGISPSVIKSAVPFIAHPLAYIFNLSFSTGYFPSNLKIAKVIPVYKSGDRHDIHNYRPISILPCFSKILERLVYNRLSSFISCFHLLSDHQYGFRSNHSTDMALIQVIDKLTSALTSKMSAVGVFIDLSKAFDTIDHSILLSKLEFYGIRGVALQWFSSYLSNRQQFTFIHNSLSSRHDILHGVPQGSILGPLWFLLYINDLPHSSSSLSFTLFADDTTLLHTDSNLQSLITSLNAELNRVSSWFRANKLSLNHAKSKYMIFSKAPHSSSNTQPILINNIPISRVSSTKFLGVTIDEKLSWSDHISATAKIIARNIGVMAKLRSFLPQPSMVLLYNSLILPHLNYCNIVWAHATNHKLHSLIVLQKRAIRICTNSHPRAHSAPLFASLNTLTLTDINKLHTGIFMFKFTNNLLPHSFTSFFTSLQNTYRYSTRAHNKHNLFLPFTRTSFSISTLRFHGPRLWNTLDESLRGQLSVGGFKRLFKRSLISNYVTELQ